jgi:hypothetical protein
MNVEYESGTREEAGERPEAGREGSSRLGVLFACGIRGNNMHMQLNAVV